VRVFERVIPASPKIAWTRQLATSRKRRLIERSAILASLVLFLYAPTLAALVRQWWTNSDYGHGFFIPVFSGYVLWRDQRVWTEEQMRPSNLGLLVMVGAVALLIFGLLGAELFISRLSLLVLVTGVILFLAGWRTLRAVSFPLGYLLFMIPIPVLMYNQLTFPLQLLASHFAAFCLELIQVPVLRNGNVLSFSNYSLEIVEACSGIRSLMTLIAFAVAYGYLLEPRRWVRHSLIFSMLPIAIVSNAIRITVAGVIAHRFGAATAEGFLHGFSSWTIFVASLALLCGLHGLFRQIAGAREAAAHA